MRGFEAYPLRVDGASSEARLFVGRLPDTLRPDPAGFEALWALHPAEPPDLVIHGRVVQAPRWQAAYGADYAYSGRRQAARPLPAALAPYLDWARARVDPRLDGLLLNWYDAARGHYIGKHRDANAGRVVGSPIVTLSLGAARVFRLRPWRGRGFVDLVADDGAVFVMPWETNLTWTHEVPRRAADAGRRISITARAFRV